MLTGLFFGGREHRGKDEEKEKATEENTVLSFSGKNGSFVFIINFLLLEELTEKKKKNVDWMFN